MADDIEMTVGGGKRRSHRHHEKKKESPNRCGQCALTTCACVAICPGCDLNDYYEDIVVRRDVNYANTKRALEMVEAFIVERGLILIGGMGIDIALKLIGKPGIYLNEKLPDYDFLSPDTAKDATDLARRLCKAGLPNVSAINAYHTTTIRVRTNFIFVADLGYCPKAIYDRIPTLMAGKLRVIHPHFQIIDIHRGLCYPFERIMLQPVAFHRWRKDCARYDVLTAAFPIDGPGGVDEAKANESSIPAMARAKLDLKILSGNCLAGWAGLDYWLKIANNETFDPANVQIPEGERIQLYADDIAGLRARAEQNSIVNYEARLGHLPNSSLMTIDGQKYEIFDNFGYLLSAERVEIGGATVHTINLQGCMLFLLAKIYLYADSQPGLKLLARRLYSKCASAVATARSPGLLPSTNVYGESSLDDAYLIQRRRFVARITGQRVTTDDSISGIYPTEPACEANIHFKYEESPYFKISGAKIEGTPPSRKLEELPIRNDQGP